VAALENATRLDVNELVIDLPVAGLRFKGNARVDGEGAAEGGILRSDSEMEIRNLDALIDMAMELAGSEEGRQQLMAATTMLKLVGEERTNAVGEVVHHFRIQASSLGELVVNGNDLAPLLMGGGN
jgi:hypothetical protein